MTDGEPDRRHRTALELADWRRRVADLYAAVRAEAAHGSRGAPGSSGATTREELFRTHPQSPVPAADRAGVPGAPLAVRRRAPLRGRAGRRAGRRRAAASTAPRSPSRPFGGLSLSLPISTGGEEAFTRIGWVDVPFRGGAAVASALYWMAGYAGGLFLPFRDATNGRETYGAGRYLLDTAKSADLGPGAAPGTPRPRLQLRVPPVVRVRPAVVLPARAAGEPPRPPHRGRRAPDLTARRTIAAMDLPPPALSCRDRVREFLEQPLYADARDGRRGRRAAPGGDLVPARARRPHPRQHRAGPRAGPAELAAGAAGVAGRRRPRGPVPLGRAAGRGRGGDRRRRQAREDIVALAVRYGEADEDSVARVPDPAADLVPAADHRASHDHLGRLSARRWHRCEFGLQLWPQRTTWPEYRDAAIAAEAAGWDSIWTWDHLLAIQGPWQQPIFEGWTLLAAVAAVTSRVRLGLMVGANTFRNPGLTTKLATTLDHVSNGRAVLGIGGAWFEREHEAFGIDFGKSVGERLDWLEEAVPLMRRLLDGEQVTHEGRFYTLVDALCEPRPIQAHLPILVGGSGPKKTLRTVARHADALEHERRPSRR